MFDSDENAAEIKQYNIEGFPTLILKAGGKACFYFYESKEYFHLDKNGKLVNYLGGVIYRSEINNRAIQGGIYSWPRANNYYRLAKECGL